MEVPVKTDFFLTALSPYCAHTLKSALSALCVQCSFNGRIFNFIVIGPQRNHYSTEAAVAWFALVLYTALYNLHINFHTLNMVFHPVLVCGGRNVVMCGNSSCSGTIALGSLGKLFPHKLFVSVLQWELYIVFACKHLIDWCACFWIYSYSGCVL